MEFVIFYIVFSYLFMIGPLLDEGSVPKYQLVAAWLFSPVFMAVFLGMKCRD